MKNIPDTFSIDYACLQIFPFETVIFYNVPGPFLEIKSANTHKKTFPLPPTPSVHLKIKIAVMVRHGISKRFHEKIGDCEQSSCTSILFMVEIVFVLLQ